MKLLFKKQRTGAGTQNSIRISKSTLSINGMSIARIVDEKKVNFVGIGINKEGNLCLYHSTDSSMGLFKLHKQQTCESYRVVLSGKGAKQAIEPYIGEYEIKYISLENKKYKEIILKKI